MRYSPAKHDAQPHSASDATSVLVNGPSLVSAESDVFNELGAEGEEEMDGGSREDEEAGNAEDDDEGRLEGDEDGGGEDIDKDADLAGDDRTSNEGEGIAEDDGCRRASV